MQLATASGCELPLAVADRGKDKCEHLDDHLSLEYGWPKGSARGHSAVALDLAEMLCERELRYRSVESHCDLLDSVYNYAEGSNSRANLPNYHLVPENVSSELNVSRRHVFTSLFELVPDVTQPLMKIVFHKAYIDIRRESARKHGLDSSPK